MTTLTPELIAKAKATKSAEELMALAKENNIEMTEEEAKTYFEQLNASGPLSDDELDAVAGAGAGGVKCFTGILVKNNAIQLLNGHKCPYCGAMSGVEQVRDGMVRLDGSAVNSSYIFCVQCGKTFAPSSTPVKMGKMQNL